MHGSNLGFPIRTLLAIFDLQIIPMLPTEFQVNWPIDQEKKRKMDSEDGRHLGFPIGMVLAIFDLRHPDASHQVSSWLAFRFRIRSSEK